MASGRARIRRAGIVLAVLAVCAGFVSVPGAPASSHECPPTCHYDDPSYEDALIVAGAAVSVPALVSAEAAAELAAWYELEAALGAVATLGEAEVALGTAEVFALGTEVGVASTLSLAIPIVAVGTAVVVSYLVLTADRQELSPFSANILSRECDYEGAGWIPQYEEGSLWTPIWGTPYIFNVWGIECPEPIHTAHHATWLMEPVLFKSSQIDSQGELDACRDWVTDHPGYTGLIGNDIAYWEFQVWQSFAARIAGHMGGPGTWQQQSDYPTRNHWLFDPGDYPPLDPWNNISYPSSCGMQLYVAPPQALVSKLVSTPTAATTHGPEWSPDGDVIFPTPNRTPDFVQAREVLADGSVTFRDAIEDQLDLATVLGPDCEYPTALTADVCRHALRSAGFRGWIRYAWAEPALEDEDELLRAPGEVVDVLRSPYWLPLAPGQHYEPQTELRIEVQPDPNPPEGGESLPPDAPPCEGLECFQTGGTPSFQLHLPDIETPCEKFPFGVFCWIMDQLGSWFDQPPIPWHLNVDSWEIPGTGQSFPAFAWDFAAPGAAALPFIQQLTGDELDGGGGVFGLLRNVLGFMLWLWGLWVYGKRKFGGKGLPDGDAALPEEIGA